MTLQTSTIRPGLLVSLKTTIRGNVKYSTETIEAERRQVDGSKFAAWKTEKVVADAAEDERATEARSKARHAVTRVCAASAFGLLCPQDKAEELSAGIDEARRIAGEFNATARFSQIDVYCIAGKVAGDEAEAVRAINSEVRSLLDDMERGVANMDVAAIRKAATDARNIGAMLRPEVAARVQEAIDAARTAARRMVKAGETAALEVDRLTLAKIRGARTEFLDLDGAAEVAAPTIAARAVDFEPDAPAWKQEVEAFGASLDEPRALDLDEPTPPTFRPAPAPMFSLEF